MTKYNIFCTPEQTKRAYKLGAPLDEVYIQIDTRKVWYTLQKKDPKWQDCDAYYIPTTEQMIGWLREKGLYVQVMIYGHKSYQFEIYTIGSFDDALILSSFFETYEQATLAAIDAALGFLEKGGNNG